MPARVVVDGRVNCSVVIESESWMLVIGLGLVDCLNVTEFAAILAHEVGHLRQRKPRSYPGVMDREEELEADRVACRLVGGEALLGRPSQM